MLGCSIYLVSKLEQKGLLRPIRIGGRVYYDAAEVERAPRPGDRREEASHNATMSKLAREADELRARSEREFERWAERREDAEHAWRELRRASPAKPVVEKKVSLLDELIKRMRGW